MCRLGHRSTSSRDQFLIKQAKNWFGRFRIRPSGMALKEVVQQGTGISARIRLPTSEDIRITAPNVELESFPMQLTKECLLFYHPETEILARSVAETSQGRVELGDIKWA